MTNNCTKGTEEGFDAYALRLYQNREAYGLTSFDIAKLLNDAAGTHKGESAWRKYYKAFRQGTMYAQSSLPTILCLSDLHYPFILPIETFAAYRGINTLVLNGDLLDCQSLSVFDKSYRINPVDEMRGLRDYLRDLITYLNCRKVFITVGNHDIRLKSYLAGKIDTEIKELLPDTPLEYLFVDGWIHYDKLTHAKTNYAPLCNILSNVAFTYTGTWWCKVGRTIFCHPSAFSSAILKTAEKAVAYFHNIGEDFDCLVLGHTHRCGKAQQGGGVHAHRLPPGRPPPQSVQLGPYRLLARHMPLLLCVGRPKCSRSRCGGHYIPLSGKIESERGRPAKPFPAKFPRNPAPRPSAALL